MAASAGAWYRVGTVNVSANSTNVAGIETAWENDLIAIAIGDAFTVDSKTWYEVIAVNSDVSITIDRPFEGDSESSKEYAILRNTSGTILTRLAGQIAVQFNQKQLFLDELRNWLTSEDETATLTDSHGIEHVVKTVNKIQEITGTAADRDIIDDPLDNTVGRVLTAGAGGVLGSAPVINHRDELPLGASAIIPNKSNDDAVLAGMPDLGVAPSTVTFWEVKRGGAATRSVYEATEVFGAGDGNKGRRFIGVFQDATFRGWSEVFTSSAYNFNLIANYDLNTSQYLCRITKRSSGRLRFFRDLSGKNESMATSIAVTGTFGLRRADTGFIAYSNLQASEFTIAGTATCRLCVEIINSEASNLINADEYEYELCPISTDCKVELVY